MARNKRDAIREHRITMEITVDAYTPEERVMGWYYYLEGKLHFPFAAKVDKETKEAIADWHYWLDKGYAF